MAAANTHRAIPPEVKEEQLERITRWLLTDAAYRHPRSNRALALEIGLSPAHCARLTNAINSGLGDVHLDAEKYAMANYKSVVRVLTQAAVAGNKDAQKLYFEYIIKPAREQTKVQSKQRSQLIDAALKLLPENKPRRLNDGDMSQHDISPAEPPALSLPAPPPAAPPPTPTEAPENPRGDA